MQELDKLTMSIFLPLLCFILKIICQNKYRWNLLRASIKNIEFMYLAYFIEIYFMEKFFSNAGNNRFRCNCAEHIL